MQYKIARNIAMIEIVLLLGCAVIHGAENASSSANASNPHAKTAAAEPVVRPATIYVTDFYLDPSQIQKQGPMGRGGVVQRRFGNLLKEDSSNKARKLISVLSNTIAAELRKAGQGAEYRPDPDGLRSDFVLSDPRLPKEGWLVSGWFVTVDEGNRLLASAVGFGAGAGNVEIQVVVSDLSKNGAEPFLYIGSSSDDKLRPGGLVMKNPYAVAAKFVTSRGATEKDVKKQGKEIAKSLLNYMKNSSN